MKYYLVTAKCGHVGKGKYIEKTFAIEANNAKIAAKIVLARPKVKKQLKNAISEVNEVEYSKFAEFLKYNQEDKYLHSHSKKEILEILYSGDIIPLDFYTKEKKKEFESRMERISYQIKKRAYKENLVYEY